MSITEKFRNKLFKKKNYSYEYYSFDSRTTTNQTIEENTSKKTKKKVTFDEYLEIIDIESFKEYNKIDNTLEYETIEKKYTSECNECCNLF